MPSLTEQFLLLAITVMDDADLDVALVSVVFAAMGTAGQR